MTRYSRELENPDLAKIVKTTSSLNLQRLWVMEHFRVLPTDPRLEELTDIQAGILFQAWVQLDEPSIRRAAREEISKPKFDPSALRAMGYSEDQIATIKRNF